MWETNGVVVVGVVRGPNSKAGYRRTKSASITSCLAQAELGAEDGRVPMPRILAEERSSGSFLSLSGRVRLRGCHCMTSPLMPVCLPGLFGMADLISGKHFHHGEAVELAQAGSA